MRHITLKGWNIDVEETTVQKPAGPDGPMVDAPGWVLVFHEVIPNTGDTLRFSMGEEVKDFVVRKLTGGIVTAKQIPRVDGPVI